MRPFSSKELREMSQQNVVEHMAADVNNPKKNDTFWYLGRTRCTVRGETLKPGGVNLAEAIVQIETVQGTPITFLYSESWRYLSATQIPFYKKWPLQKQ